MKKTRKNRKGFTLVEMLLSLAIITLIGGVIGGVCFSISHSFVTTYNIDDSADYAMLYARGFENSFLAITQGNGTAGQTWTWRIENPKGNGSAPTLKVRDSKGSDEDVFTPKFIGNSSTPSKWSVIMFYKVEETTNGTNTSTLVDYRLYIRDNYARTDYIYRYDGSFWVPRFQERAKSSGATGRKIMVDTSSSPMSESTMKNFCTDPSGNYSQKAFNSIKDGLDPTYYSSIVYKWG